MPETKTKTPKAATCPKGHTNAAVYEGDNDHKQNTIFCGACGQRYPTT